jgi:CHAD domain-containing protein
MNLVTAEYLLPSDSDHLELAERVTARQACSEDSAVTLSRHIYDSFDWRLFLAGLTLEWGLSEAAAADHHDRCASTPASAEDGQAALVVPENGLVLTLREQRDPSAAPVLQGSALEPGFLSEMPDGPVRERLDGLLGIRRLLPMTELISARSRLRLLNEDRKTVVRLVIERNRFRNPANGETGDLSARLRLKPVRGYAREFAEVEQWVRNELGLEPIERPQVLEALTAAGCRPGGYSSKLDYRLDPDQRADLATKEIHRGLLKTLEANVEGARRNLDSEFLHDLRVATRRTRSALSQIKEVFPAAEVDDFKQRFAWLQQVTGPMRDLDVYLLDLPALEERLPESLRDDLRPLRGLLNDQYQSVQAELAKALESDPFDALLRDWHAFLDAPAPDGPEAGQPGASQPSGGGDSTAPPPKRAQQPIKRVANQRIRKMLERVRSEGRAITETSPPEELHELRKSCKKLRYLMEFFQSLYEPARIREQIKQTKVLLDNLGRFQDTAVQAQHLRETAEAEGCRDGGIPPATLLAMGLLIGQLQGEQARARSGFSEVFRGFDSDANAARFDALLSDGKGRKRQTGRR